jgi:pentatricopeptide repeat protein
VCVGKFSIFSLHLTASSGRLDEALQQFYQLDGRTNVEADTESYTTIIIALARARRLLPAENLFVQMRNVRFGFVCYCCGFVFICFSCLFVCFFFLD